MNVERYQKIKSLLIQALELPVDQQPFFLDKACGGDTALRAEVESLLKQQPEAAFLEQDAIALDEEHGTGALLGSKIGRIRVERLLARGGMGEVFAGTDELLQRPVAVKLMRSQWRLSQKSRDNFLSEARALSALGHPNICQVYDFFVEADRDVLVLELIEGQTLRHLLDKGQLKPGSKTALDVALQVAAALVAAHERGIAHRDLKPANIMLSTDSQVKVLDFGLARSADASVAVNADESANGKSPGSAANSGESSRQVQQTLLAGTPGYLAPEQARGEPSTTASDLWSFGLLLIELFAGRQGHPAQQTGEQLLERARHGQIDIPDNLPSAETRLLQRLLSYQPADRPTARELQTALQKIEARPRQRIRYALVASLLLTMTVVGIKYTTDLQRERSAALQERDRAETAQAQAEDLSSFMLQELYSGLLEVGRLDLLEPVALKAVDYYSGINQKKLQANQGESALALMRIAEVLELQGKPNESVAAYQRSVAAIEPLALANPDDALLNYRLGMAELELSDMLNATGQMPAAERTAKNGIEIGRRLTTGYEPGEGPSDDETPDNTDRWKLLLKAIFQQADNLIRTGRSAAAQPLIDESAQIAAAATSINPAFQGDTAAILWQRCMAYIELKKVDDLIQVCLASLDLDRQAYLDDPDNYQALRIYIGSKWLLSNAYRRLEKYAEALQESSEAETLVRELLAREPDQALMQNLLVTILASSGQSLHALGQTQAAQALWLEGVNISAALLEAGDELHLMNTYVSVLAPLGHIEAARPFARRIYDMGWRRWEFMRACYQLELVPECKTNKP